MAIGTYTNDFGASTTWVATADATTDNGGTWTRQGGSTTNGTTDADAQIQGTACIRVTPGTSAQTRADYGISFLDNANADISAGKAIYMWRNMFQPGNTGISGENAWTVTFSSDTAYPPTTNSKRYFLNGYDANPEGGWKCYAVEPASVAGHGINGATPTWTAIRAYSVMARAITGLSANTQVAGVIDAMKVGTGFTAITGGNATSSLTIADAYEVDVASLLGVIANVAGIYNITGKLAWGSTAQTAPTVFSDNGQSVLYPFSFVSSTFNEFKVLGSTTNSQYTIWQVGLYDPVTTISSAGYSIKGAKRAGSLHGHWMWNKAGTAGSQSTVVTANHTLYAGSSRGVSQTFINNGFGNKITAVKFYLAKTGAPTGNVTANLYAISGTSGAGGIPTGTALAVSNPLDITTLTTTRQEITFTFPTSQQFAMTEGTSYVITVEYNSGNATNNLLVGYDGTGGALSHIYPAHPGNLALQATGGAWTANNTTDLAFVLYVESSPMPWTFVGSDSRAIVKKYSSQFNDLKSATYNANTRSFALTCTASNSTTMTTAGSYYTSGVVPGMKITGTGITGDVYIVSVQSATSATVSSTINISSVSVTFTDGSEIRDCSYSNSGSITTNAIPMIGCTFSAIGLREPFNHTKYLTVTPTGVSALQNCSFANNNGAHSLDITTAGSCNFNNLSFSGGGAQNTTSADVNNSSASGTVNITNINGSQHNYTLRNSSSGTINVYDRVVVTTVDGAGAAVQNSRTYLYVNSLPAGETESMPTANRALATDASGIVNQDTQKYNYAVSTLKTWDQFYYKIFKFGKQPFITGLTVSGSEELTATLLTDSNVVAANATTALSAGSGITITRHGTGETDTRAMKVMHYDGGTAAIVAGNTLTGASSGASGVVVEVVGTTTSGVVVLQNWNGTEYTNNENLQVGGATKALADTSGGAESFYQEYTWLVDCNSLSYATVYDYLSAYFDQASPDATMIKVFKWSGTSNNQNLLYKAAKYYSVRNGTEGVWFAKGTGEVQYWTSNSGAQYVPPTSVTLALTGLKTDSEVRIFRTSDQSEVTGTESSGTSFSYNYVYTGDIGVYIVVFHLNYGPIMLEGQTLGSSNQSIPIQQITDRQYITNDGVDPLGTY